jgi:hypothetical protein
MGAVTWSVLLTDLPPGGHIDRDGPGVFTADFSTTETTRTLSYPGLQVGLRVE